jgi:hypothetical protein
MKDVIEIIKKYIIIVLNSKKLKNFLYITIATSNEMLEMVERKLIVEVLIPATFILK